LIIGQRVRLLISHAARRIFGKIKPLPCTLSKKGNNIKRLEKFLKSSFLIAV